MGVNTYQMVTDRIIAELEKGNIPWQKPWTGTCDGAFNRVSKKPYSLLNQLMLKHQGEYATLKQWNDLGGRVKKGEKSETVVFWKWLQVADKEIEDGEIEFKNIPMLRYINVFHISQVTGVEPLNKKLLKNKITTQAEIDEIVNDYAERAGVKIESDRLSSRACYSPSLDIITVPNIKQFKKVNEYYSTLFHEMVHSTGNEKRLNRFDKNSAGFGTESYSKEELVAEIGAAAIMNKLGLETEKTFKNSAAYIQSWLTALKNDNKLIVSAAGKAEKAVDLIFNTEETTTKTAA